MHKYKILQAGQVPPENLVFLQNLLNFIITKYFKQEVHDDLSVCENDWSPCGHSGCEPEISTLGR